MKKYRKPILWVGAVYAVLTIILIGLGSQETYTTLTTTLRETSADVFQGNWGKFGQAGLLFATLAASGLTGTVTEAQQIYSVLLILLVWLTTIWLLRNLIAGHKVKARDALYNAGAPIVPAFLLGLLLVIQLLPFGIATIGYSAATASGLLEGGIQAMLFWIVAGLLAVMSLYWITSTFFALIVVTLPGMYPWQALRTAGDMVIGRRLRILLRFLWMTLVTSVFWALLLIPFILIDGWLKGIWPQLEWLPIIPVVLLLLGTATVIWSACYVYLLYRKVVDDNARPA